MGVDDPHEYDAFAATEDALDERLQEIGDEPRSRFAKDEAARQKTRIAHRNVVFAAFDLWMGIVK